MGISLPFFESDNGVLNKAARIATGDIVGNCKPYKAGLLEEEAICLIAGLDYCTPWNRDTSINAMHAMCLFDSSVVRNSLLSVCTTRDGKNYAGDKDYWDTMIWAMGAWHYLSINDDAEFRIFAYDVIKNSLAKFEAEELDDDGLFMGGAVYGDGIAAYPDKYAKTANYGTNIMDWPAANPEKRSKKGFGVPMKTLSTNCVYYAAYIIAGKLAEQFGEDSSEYVAKAQRTKDAINKNFWNEKTGRYDYLFDDTIRCDHAEALGLSFAMLFGVADDAKCESIIKNTYVTDHGIACVWPSFSRYRIGNDYGRHSGAVWPHAEGFWAIANLRKGNTAGFEKEFFSLAHKAVRDLQFAEIYHPITGEVYGGLQERAKEGYSLWKSCQKQSWSATAFWAMIFYGIIGIDITDTSIIIKPYLPVSLNHVTLKNLTIGDAEISIKIDRDSDAPKTIEIPKNLKGKQSYNLSV